jgi:hypothetical protein
MPQAIKKTGGGTFDPDLHGLHFFATGLQWHLRVSAAGHKSYLVAVNHISEGKKGNDELELLLTIPNVRVFLDSGIFTLCADHARKNDLQLEEVFGYQPEQLTGYEKLRDRYLDLIQKYSDRLWGYVELDMGGTETKQRVRGQMEAQGIRPIPVFHPMHDSWEYYEQLITEYDRICVGNIVNASPKTRAMVLTEAAMRKRRINSECFIHILGSSAGGLITSLRFESCDSSSWNSRLRFPVLNNVHLDGNTSGLPSWFLYEQNGDAGVITQSGLTCAYQHHLFNVGRNGYLSELLEHQL